MLHLMWPKSPKSHFGWKGALEIGIHLKKFKDMLHNLVITNYDMISSNFEKYNLNP
jgi:hypothetical protein